MNHGLLMFLAGICTLFVIFTGAAYVRLRMDVWINKLHSHLTAPLPSENAGKEPK